MSLRRAAVSVANASALLGPASAQRTWQPVRGLFNFSFSKLAGVTKDKGQRKLFDVEWHDEYANLGADARQTHKFMVDEDQRLRKSTVFLSPLRRQIFGELIKHRAQFQQVIVPGVQVDSAALLDGSTLYPSTTPSGAPCWIKADEGGEHIVASAEPRAPLTSRSIVRSPCNAIIACRSPTIYSGSAVSFAASVRASAHAHRECAHSLADCSALHPLGRLLCADDTGQLFHQIVDLKLNAGQDKVALLINDGRHPDAFTCVIKPVGMSVHYKGVMPEGGPADELEAVHSVQWMREGQHVVYSRVGAGGTPTEVWLHRVGQPESADRQLYEEEYEGFHVHVGLTSDKRFVTVTALSKSSTEVHLVDSMRPDSAPQLVHERQPGFMYWVAHAHEQLIIMSNGGDGDEYHISRCPLSSLGVSTDDIKLGSDAWTTVVSSDVGCLEDMMVYAKYLVLSCREKGLPVLRVARLRDLGVRDKVNEVSETISPARSVPVSSLQKLALPLWAMHVVAGANLQFDSNKHVVHVSSPAHPEEEVQLCLDTGQRLSPMGSRAYVAKNEPPGVHPSNLSGLDVRRIQVAIAADPQEADYLEMLYRLLPQEVLADGDAEPQREPKVGMTPYSLYLTIVHRPSAVTSPLGVAPLPIIMRAYGAYGLPADLRFCADDLPLLDRGAVIVTAHIRGGGEHGRAWHLAGTVQRKWASLYDYAAALHHLVEHGYTAPGMIATDSFSAGALVAAHALNKVPEVFAAALFRRPFVTLLNSMTDPSLPMTAHEYDEWGDPADEDVVKLWAHLSPHKHIRPAAYPPILVTSGTNDTRVEWWGPVKFAWRLRAHQQSQAPVLLSWGLDGHICEQPNQVALEKTFLLLHLLPPEDTTLDGDVADTWST